MADEHQAQVKCGYCGRLMWVAWDLRYDEKAAPGNRFSQVKCEGCQGATRYTGRMRGEVASRTRKTASDNIGWAGIV